MRTRERWTWGLGAVALALAVLGVGGAVRPVLIALGALLAAALALQVTSRRGLGRTPLATVLGLALVLSALQLVPLPLPLAEAIDPQGQALRKEGLALLDQAESFAPLSRDPSSTRHGVALLVLFAAAGYIALRLAATERGRFALVGGVVLVGTAAIAVTVAHEALGATALWGLYQPRQATPALLGPLLNPNHLGCLFALTAVAALGLAMHAAQPGARRVAWGLCAAVAVAATLLVQSRGAAVALLAGGIICAGTLVGQRLRGREDRAAPPRLSLNSVAIGVVALCALALLVYRAGGSVSDQLRATRADEWNDPGTKYAAWRSAMHLVAESPWIGVGRGAFEVSFPRVHPAAGRVTFSHPENEYVQAVVEWGLPGALLLAAAVGWLAVSAARRWRTGAVTSGALGACAVVAVQSVVDFGLELPGLALPTIALCAALVHVPLREAAAAARRRMSLARGVAVVFTLAAAAALFSPATALPREAHAALATGDEAAVRAAALRAPHDYLPFARLGEAAARRGDASALPLLNHALRLHPTHPGVHRAAARWLLAHGAASQAALEYATALRNSAAVAPLVREIVRAFPDPERAAAAIPDDYPTPEHIARILAEEKAPRVSLAYLRRVAHAHPNAPRVGELLYTAALAAGDLGLAEQAARLRHQHAPSAAALLALGKVLVKRERLEEAAATLEGVGQVAGKPEDRTAAHLLLCDVELARQRWAAARRCLDALAETPAARALLLEIARRRARADAGERAAGGTP